MNIGGRVLLRHDEWLLAPSYWDAVTFGLVRTAMQAAALSDRGVSAIANGSHTAGSAVDLDSACCLADSSVSEQSLVVTRHTCLRVHSVQHEPPSHSLSLTAVLRHNKVQSDWAGLPDDHHFRILFFHQNPKASMIGALRALMARDRRALLIECAAHGHVGDDDREVQAEKRHDGQLRCCRVV